jgi:hypothetical protein
MPWFFCRVYLILGPTNSVLFCFVPLNSHSLLPRQQAKLSNKGFLALTFAGRTVIPACMQYLLVGGAKKLPTLPARCRRSFSVGAPKKEPKGGVPDPS